GEVEFLFKARDLRNVGFAIKPKKSPVRVVDGWRIVVEPGTPLLEQGTDENNSKLARQRSQAIGHRAGKRISEFKQGRILDRAEVRRQKQLLGDDDVRPPCGSGANERFVMVE